MNLTLLPAISLALLPLAAAAELPNTPVRLPPLPSIGSETVVGTGLPVARPSAPSCTVELFAMREFQGEARAPIDYAPPAGCTGPWLKVVLEADFKSPRGNNSIAPPSST